MAVVLLLADVCGAQTPITSCGATIGTSGVYRVTADLAYSGAANGACITVATSDVTLDLASHTISGPGNLPDADGILLASRTDSISVINGTVTGFGNGVLSKSSEAVFNNLTAIKNDVGIFLFTASEDRIVNSTLSNNSKYGVLTINAFINLIAHDSISNNGEYGVWIQAGRQELVNKDTIANNVLAGVYIGCSASGPGGSCAGSALLAPTQNMVLNNVVSGGRYGIAIDSTSDGNRVLNNQAIGASIDDLWDANAGCGTDTWYLDSFQSVNQGCIQ